LSSSVSSAIPLGHESRPIVAPKPARHFHAVYEAGMNGDD
jgi:hypothetical protein